MKNILLKIEHSFSILYVLVIGFVAFILWATLFDIDETVRAQGIIVSNGNTQIIQVADGGVLSKLFVSEGEKVEQGQLLATLEKDIAQAGYLKVKSEVAYLQAALARANAQASGMPIVFDKLAQSYPDFVQAQQVLYNQRQGAFEKEISMLKKVLVINDKEWNIVKELEAFGDVSKMELLVAEQKKLTTERQIFEVDNKYYQQVSSEIGQLEGQLEANIHKLKKQESILEYTNIWAPVSGVVKELKVTTVGGVLQSGSQIMEISPSKGGVIMKVEINPVNIGRIKLGMPVTIKLDAFDFAIFGSLEGVVSYISSDTLFDTDPNGRQVTFYQVNVEIQEGKDYLNSRTNEIKVKLGMSGSVDIRVGVRSLFVYLTKPINRGFSGALNER